MSGGLIAKENALLRAENEQLRKQLGYANSTILKAESVVSWFAEIMDTRSHRALSALRRLLHLQPEMPKGVLADVRLKYATEQVNGKYMKKTHHP